MDLCRDDECAKYFAAFISLQLIMFIQITNFIFQNSFHIYKHILIQKGDGIPFLYIFLFDSLENRVNPT